MVKIHFKSKTTKKISFLLKEKEKRKVIIEMKIKILTGMTFFIQWELFFIF